MYKSEADIVNDRIDLAITKLSIAERAIDRFRDSSNKIAELTDQIMIEKVKLTKPAFDSLFDELIEALRENNILAQIILGK